MKIESPPFLPINRQELIQGTNLLTIILLSALGTARYLVMGPEHFPLPGLVVVIACLINAVYLKRGGSVDIAAKALIGICLFGLFFGGYNTGGFGGPVVLFSPLIPILTMLLLNGRAGWIAVGLVCLVLVALYGLELNGVVPANPNSPGRILMGRFITLISISLAATWVVWSFARVTHKLLEKIERQSNTDYLTGILNRRAFETNLEREIGRAKRQDGWLSLIITDVDFFKLYNDSNGHQAGDLCLTRVAWVISSCSARATDMVGRFGGEEFVIILPDTDSDGAYKVAEKIRRKMLQQNIPYGPENPNPVSLTLGVVSARGHMIENRDQLIRQADDYLYQGKSQGRNCVVGGILMPPQTSTDNSVIRLTPK
jgi:diguanylate cyclase (GGDEF)-like protein